MEHWRTGLDYDDTLEEAIVHTGCCAGMTALVVGEEVSADGRSVLEAAVAGTEVMCKIGIVAAGKFHARGFHPTALCSTFGAAAPRENCIALSWVNGAMCLESVAVRARVSSNIWLMVPGQNECIPVGQPMAE